MILDTIIASTRKRLADTKRTIPPKMLLKELEAVDTAPRGFGAALTGYDGVSIIAEVKKASPSKGLIRPDFEPAMIAKEYEEAKVQAMSVLTEPEFFRGAPEFLKQIRRQTAIPLLRKDFIVDEYQIYEARLWGADAVLLIAAALDDTQFHELYQKARQLELDVLVETHTREEVLRAAECATMIGINNRNLHTFEEDITTTERLLHDVPPGVVTVAESAIRSHEDYEYLKTLGVDAALIGEAFMREESIKDAVRRMRDGI